MAALIIGIILFFFAPGLLVTLLGITGIAAAIVSAIISAIIALLLIYAVVSKIQMRKKLKEISDEAVFFAAVNDQLIQPFQMQSPDTGMQRKLEAIWKRCSDKPSHNNFCSRYDQGKRDIRKVQENYLRNLNHESHRFIMFYYYIRYGFGYYEGFEFTDIQMRSRLNGASGSAYRDILSRCKLQCDGINVGGLRMAYNDGYKHFVKLKPPIYTKWV